MSAMNLAPRSIALHADRVLRPTELRGVNSSTILRLLIETGPISRAEVSSALGLTQGGVTRIIGDLIDQGLVADGERIAATTRGRPRVPVGVVPRSRLSIGVHIGVRFLHAALTDLLGQTVSSRRVPHDGSIESVIELCTTLISDLKGEASAPLLGVGIISGGWVESSSGMLRRHELLDWTEVALRDRLKESTGLDVHIDTSARAHALADVFYGVAHGHSDFAHVFVGHVVEASLVLGGRVHVGPHGLGGSLSEWMLDDGTGRAVRAGDLVSDGAVIRHAEATGLIPSGSSFDEVLALAESPDPRAPRAIALLHERARRVGVLTAALTDLVGLSLLIVSSGVVSLPSSVEHIEAGLRAARPNLPTPEIRTEANVGDTLTRAASTVVLNATL